MSNKKKDTDYSISFEIEGPKDYSIVYDDGYEDVVISFEGEPIQEDSIILTETMPVNFTADYTVLSEGDYSFTIKSDDEDQKND
jgi:hypothetical protein